MTLKAKKFKEPLSWPLYLAILSLFLFHCKNRSEINLEKSSDSNSIAEVSTIVKETYRVPIKESSGICSYTDPLSKKTMAIIVNDADWKLTLVDLDSIGKSPSSTITIDLTEEVKKHFPRYVDNNGSQLEGAQSDHNGNVFLLSEGRSAVIVYNIPQKKIVAHINFNSENNSKLKSQRKSEPGSWMEGIILLPNGHIIAAKEKRPPLLVEFGPASDAPNGYLDTEMKDSKSSDAFSSKVGIDANSKSPLEVDYEPLAIWEPGKSFSDNLDISELAVDSEGRMILLSDQLRSIIGIEKVLKPNEAKFGAKKIWRLPKEIEKAEGLMINQDGSFLVLSDTNESHKSLFHVIDRP